MEHIGKLISATARNSHIYYKHAFEKMGINGSENVFILCICENPGKTQEWLAEELLLNKSTIARVLAALEQKGMIERKISQKDRRIFHVFPTEKALAVCPEVKKMLNDWNEKLTSGFLEGEKEQAAMILKRIMENAIKYAKSGVNEDE